MERWSRYVVLLHLPHGRSAAHVRQALAARMTTLPAQLRRTLTWDRVDAVARELNNRPRATLAWSKPSEVFAQAVASIG